MALNMLTVAGGLALLGAMIRDRFAGTKSARWVVPAIAAVMAGVMPVSRLAEAFV